MSEATSIQNAYFVSLVRHGIAQGMSRREAEQAAGQEAPEAHAAHLLHQAPQLRQRRALRAGHGRGLLHPGDQPPLYRARSGSSRRSRASARRSFERAGRGGPGGSGGPCLNAYA